MKKQHPTFDKVDEIVYKVLRVVSYQEECHGIDIAWEG